VDRNPLWIIETKITTVPTIIIIDEPFPMFGSPFKSMTSDPRKYTIRNAFGESMNGDIVEVYSSWIVLITTITIPDFPKCAWMMTNMHRTIPGKLSKYTPNKY
jgi:hypothetical protein